MIRVYIIDDHEVLREGVKKVLAKSGNVLVAGEAGTGRQAIKELKEAEVDVVLLDISLPDLDGLEVLKRIRAQRPKLPVLVFTMHAEHALAIPFLKAGANGFVTKGSPAKTLIDGIQTLHQGRNYLTQEVSGLLLQEWHHKSDQEPHQLLSIRELTVFRLMASGKSGAEIAKELGLQSCTISTYRRRILDKTGLRNNAEIIHYALEHKLV